ncbi:Flavin-dependent monooxygenase, oxygenase subunit HsaA [Rhodococcus sp. T7]|nr:Flavin-dependent monooxygenase, oxygenase subunit HsaA [Rhodococcus sp. T7]
MTQLTAPPRSTRAAELLELAQALKPDLRAHNEQTEADRWIGDELSRRLNDGGFYRMLAPERFGGAELTLRETLEILTTIAEGCPSAAWVAGIHNAAIWLGSLYPLAAQEELFGDSEPTVVSGTLAPLGTLTPVPGGYRVSGKWGFASGVLDATWMLLGAPRPDASGGEAGPVFALVPMSSIQIHKDWDTMGLAGTGSHSVEVKDVFVPEYRIIDPVAASAGEYPSEYASEVALYRSAFLPVLSAVLVCPALGATKRMLEEYLKQVPNRRIAYTIYEKAAESVVTQTRLAEAAMLIDEAQFHQDRLGDDIDEWAQGPDYMPESLRVRARMDIGRALDLCRSAANLIFSLGGGSGIARSNPVQRLFRDVQASNSHPLQMATVQYEVYGREMLGQPQITSFI